MDFTTLTFAPSLLLIRLWPDGTWATVEDLTTGEYDHMSDDYSDLDLFSSAAWSDQALQQSIIDELDLRYSY